jgi:hypothetical protein
MHSGDVQKIGSEIEDERQLTPRGTDLGYAGEKIRFGQRLELRKLGEVPKLQAAHAPVGLHF